MKTIINTDQAWNKLHTRLQDEQLLSPESRQSTGRLLYGIKWAASVAILCMLAVGTYQIMRNEPEQLLTLQNTETNTLVSTLEDGSIVYLSGGATLSYPTHFAPEKRVVSMQGEVLFDVSGNREQPFLVETESTLVEVLGTAFSIKSADKELFVLSVQQGLVNVTLKTNHEQLLVEAGETVHLLSGQLQKTLSDGQPFEQFTENMQFKSDRLDNIIRVINKISDQPIVFSDSTLARQRLTVTFANSSPGYMIDILCVAMNLQYTTTGDTIFIKGN